MNATELRIGNYIDLGEVLEITENSVLVKRSEITSLIENYGINSIKPIPLTEQWLLDFGFNLTGIYIIFPDNEHFNIERPINGFWTIKHEFDFIPIEIQYVHQLQNLYLCLCGTHLTARS